MSADRPNERLLKTLSRKQTDPLLDQLDSTPEALAMPPGSSFGLTNANDNFHVAVRVTRLPHQGILPFEPKPAECSSPPTPLPQPLSPKGRGETRPRKLEPVHRQLLAVAPAFESPYSVKKLIRDAKYKVNSWSREKVTDLVAWGDLVRHPRNGGVSLPAGKLPGAAG